MCVLLALGNPPFCMLGYKASHYVSFWPQIAVLITNGQSDDPVDGPAKAVTDSGISLFAVGEFTDLVLFMSKVCVCVVVSACMTHLVQFLCFGM